MRSLAPAEMLSLRELLQMETNALAQAKAMQMVVTDDQLKREVEAGILAAEGRIKGIQQFINENRVIDTRGGY